MRKYRHVTTLYFRLYEVGRAWRVSINRHFQSRYLRRPREYRRRDYNFHRSRPNTDDCDESHVAGRRRNMETLADVIKSREYLKAIYRRGEIYRYGRMTAISRIPHINTAKIRDKALSHMRRRLRSQGLAFRGLRSR